MVIADGRWAPQRRGARPRPRRTSVERPSGAMAASDPADTAASRPAGAASTWFRVFGGDREVGGRSASAVTPAPEVRDVPPERTDP